MGLILSLIYPPLEFLFFTLLTLYCRKWKTGYLSKSLDIRVLYKIEMSTFWNITTPTPAQIKLQSEKPVENISEAVISEDLCVSCSKAHTDSLLSMSPGFGWSLATHLSFLSKIQIMFDIYPLQEEVHRVNLFRHTESLAAGLSCMVHAPNC